jgi:hypothetical protein
MIEPNKKIHDPEYAAFLKGKRIALVGPAPHIAGSKQKDLIDSYDLVARIGKAFYMPEEISEDVGTKIDILYNVLNDNNGPRAAGVLKPEELKHQIKWLCSSNGYFFICKVRHALFKRKNQGQVPFHIIDREYHNKFKKEVGGWLNSGFVAILDLLYYDIKELYITGITFFSEKDNKYYIPQYRNPDLAVEGCYDTTSQLKVMRRIYKEDKRIVCDGVLKEILEKEENVS